jgi:hypothetical protein
LKRGITANEEGVGSLPHYVSESRINFAAGAGVDDLDLQAKGASSRFHVFRYRSKRCTGRVDEHRNPRGCRYQLLHVSDDHELDIAFATMAREQVGGFSLPQGRR